jgi:hypothetical protein
MAVSPMSCPICEKRKSARFCPARGDSICPVCCGTEREVTLDCPADCTYLIRARKQEQDHRPRLSPSELPFDGVQIPAGVVDLNRELVTAVSLAILEFAQKSPSLADADVAAALAALAGTSRTLSSGLYYEKPPDGGPARVLYGYLAQGLRAFREQQAARAGFPAVKETDVFFVLVFLARVLRLRTNGRPRCRAFLDFLRAQFPQAAAAERETSRIVLP